jgi:aerobic carbon-monoxide dehydrogenase large subunit
METRGIVVEWDPVGEEVTIWAATQAPHEVRSVCARLLGLPEARIRVIMRDTGGGFGQKVVPLREDLCIMLAARRVPAPLKWIEDRRENLLAAGQARHEHATVTMAFDDDGTFLAAGIDHVQDVGAYPIPHPISSAAAVGMIFPGPYRIPAASFAHKSVFSNTVGRTAYRGPWQFESVAREVMIDVAARQMGIDPAELRRRNVLRSDDLPYTNGNGMPYLEMDPQATLEQALEMIGYDDFRREQAAARQGPSPGHRHLLLRRAHQPGLRPLRQRGGHDPHRPVRQGGGARGRRLGRQQHRDHRGAAHRRRPRGADRGRGHHPGRHGRHALRGRHRRQPQRGDDRRRRGASAAVLREKLQRIAAHKLEAAPEDIELADGRAHVRGSPAQAITLTELAEIAYLRLMELPPGVGSGLEASERYTAPTPMPVWANATHVCTCEVDIETGQVRLLRYVVSEDCGPMINPSVVEGQIAGGTVQGIGGALLEELAYDEDGNPVSTTFMDYLLPTAADVPLIEYGHVETPASSPGATRASARAGPSAPRPR